jgi:hypothetical protein
MLASRFLGSFGGAFSFARCERSEFCGASDCRPENIVGRNDYAPSSISNHPVKASRNFSRRSTIFASTTGKG